MVTKGNTMKTLVKNEENNICLISASASKEEVNLVFDELTKATLEAKDIKQSFSEQVQNHFIEKANTIAITEFAVQPVGKLTFEGQAPQRDADFNFTLTTEVLPKISLPKDIEKITVDVKEAPFDPEVYQQYILRLQRTKGKGTEVTEKRLPKDNDVVFIEISASYQNEPILGMEKQKLIITLTPQFQSNKEFADIARTLHVGETAKSTMHLPKAFSSPLLHDKEVDVTVFLAKIIEEELPTVDEEFAKSLGFKHLKDMQVFVTREIFNRAIVACHIEAEEKLLSSMIDALDFPVSKALFEVHKKEYLLQAQYFYKKLGLEDKDVQEKIEKSMPECESRASLMAKRQAFLMAFGYSRKIAISDAEIDKEIEKIAQASKQKVEVLKEHIFTTSAIYELQDSILAQKALRLLYSSVKKTIIPADKVQ